jgi:hypothetical protein
MGVDLAKAYDAIADLVKGSTNVAESWKSLLEYGESLVPASEWSVLKQLDITHDVAQVKKQIDLITEKEPIATEVTCIYFGLFTAMFKGSDKAYSGFYISGLVGYDPDNPDSVCDPSYFPKIRFIQSYILEAIMGLAQSELAISELADYAIMLGAAGLLSKYAMQGESGYELVVGFDDGDALQL